MSAMESRSHFKPAEPTPPPPPPPPPLGGIRDCLEKHMDLVSLEDLNKQHESHMTEHDTQPPPISLEPPSAVSTDCFFSFKFSDEGILGGEWGDLSGGRNLMGMHPVERKLCQFLCYLKRGGTDVQRLKDVLGLNDKFLHDSCFPATVEEYQDAMSKDLAGERPSHCPPGSVWEPKSLESQMPPFNFEEFKKQYERDERLANESYMQERHMLKHSVNMNLECNGAEQCS